ncbi:MAG TPA: copper resistance CopC family protein [Microlunatus sp.]|nr:copper resistance CopC family protein [Microlunatus sp.]
MRILGGRGRRSDRPASIVGTIGRLRLGLAALLFAGVSALVALPVPAQAATLVVSEPRSRQTLDEAPGWVTIAFSSDIDSAVAKLIVQGPDGDNVTTGSLIVEGTNVTTQLRDDLPQGTYTVHYRVNAAKGDVQGGAFQFAYGRGSFTTPADQKWSGSDNEPAILKGTDPNATTEPGPGSSSRPPDVEVGKSDGTTQTPDAGPTRITKKPTQGTQEPTGRATDEPTSAATDQPTTSETPTATTTSGSRLPVIVGGAVLLIALAAGAVALGLRARGGSGGDSGPIG